MALQQGNYGAQSQAQSAVPREPTVTEGIKEALGESLERLSSLKSRMADLMARTLGSEPTTSKDPPNGPRPVPNGNLSAIQLVAQDIADLIEDCHRLAARLDRIA